MKAVRLGQTIQELVQAGDNDQLVQMESFIFQKM